MRSWIRSVLNLEGFRAGQINFVFTDDVYLSEMNVKYLKHKTLTDIITFPGDGNGRIVRGDIFISLDRVRENAEKFRVTVDEELFRVMIHGILHLMGYDDSTVTLQKIMRGMENASLEILSGMTNPV